VSHIVEAPLLKRVVLEPQDIVTLQHVSKRFLELGRDDTLWREQCFNSSSFLSNLRRRQQLITSESTQEPRFRDLALALANGNGLGDSRLIKPREEARDLKARSNEKIRIMANWDPSYPDEKVQWYDEYIARNGPISTSWLQQPRNRDSPEHEYLEVRGMGLYMPPGEENATLVVGPLDDGSVCLWDISGTKGRKGSIIARSKSGLVSAFPAPQSGTGKRSKLISDGITECVSVDSQTKRAFFAVQSGMFTSYHYWHNIWFLLTPAVPGKVSWASVVGRNLLLCSHQRIIICPDQYPPTERVGLCG